LTVQPEVEESRPCPQCGTPGEAEQDGQAVYFTCPECQAEYGYRVVREAQLCAAGLVDLSAAPSPSGGSVFLGSTITRRTE
jgi:hypothetical protein